MDTSRAPADHGVVPSIDNFAKLDAAERKLFFEEAASRRGSTITAVEKDFRVCWRLKHLFALKHVPELRFHKFE